MTESNTFNVPQEQETEQPNINIKDVLMSKDIYNLIHIKYCNQNDKFYDLIHFSNHYKVLKYYFQNKNNVLLMAKDHSTGFIISKGNLIRSKFIMNCIDENNGFLPCEKINNVCIIDISEFVSKFEIDTIKRAFRTLDYRKKKQLYDKNHLEILQNLSFDFDDDDDSDVNDD